jgi:hypothetical protein
MITSALPVYCITLKSNILLAQQVKSKGPYNFAHDSGRNDKIIYVS